MNIHQKRNGSWAHAPQPLLRIDATRHARSHTRSVSSIITTGGQIFFMSDPLSVEARSRLMGRVRQRGTGPELAVRSALHRLGFRFTVRGPLNRRLPGRPDIVLPRHRMAVFVHGCFWHRHAGCAKTTTPTTRAEFWQAKFSANMARDERVMAALKTLAWRVLVVWECETEAGRESLMDKLRALRLEACCIRGIQRRHAATSLSRTAVGRRANSKVLTIST
jgi:DNA mismatch endonuclease (patch repair protein)